VPGALEVRLWPATLPVVPALDGPALDDNSEPRRELVSEDA